MEWQIKSFEELSTTELYKILSLRQEVFVVEQNCPYLDSDGYDVHSVHLMGIEDEKLIAYARIVFPSIKYDEPSIGRVVVSETERKSGFGRELMERAILVSKKIFPGLGNRISAQAHLKAFYESLGFVGVSEIYNEDGIPHIEMFLK